MTNYEGRTKFKRYLYCPMLTSSLVPDEKLLIYKTVVGGNT